MRFCLIDFETASSCELKSAGAWRYSEDVTTEVLCLGYTDGLRNAVFAQSDLAFSPDHELSSFVEDPDCTFIAHNVAFEKAIWRNIMVPLYGWSDIPDERWHDIMATCAMKALPLSLDRAVAILYLPNRKDKEGTRATLALSRTNRNGDFNRQPEKLQRVYDYNRTDLDAELGLHKRIRGLGASERKVWLLDQSINQRGVRLDLDFIAKGQRIVADATRPLLAEFRDLTGGINPTQVGQFTKWLKADGCDLPNLQKETIDAYLGIEDEEESLAGDEDDYAPSERQARLPFRHERALRIRRLLAGAAIKKLTAMRSCVSYDGRARGLLQYHGASPGRWSGRLFQPQNFPRPTLQEVIGFDKNGIEIYGGLDPAGLGEAIKTGDAEYLRSLYGEPLEAVANGLRYAILSAVGRTLVVGDFAKIEAVIVLALAGATETAENVVRNGSKVYTDIAAKIFHHPVKKDDYKEYTIGKASILGCGFQMGARKFQTRYWKEGTDDETKEVIRIYREDFAPEVPKLWRGLEDAARETVWTGRPHEAYGVTYMLEDGFLTARLPSERKLWYYNPQKTKLAVPWDDKDIRPQWGYTAQKNGHSVFVNAYGGLLTENVVQATARDLLVAGMFRCEENDYPVILTVHDEIVSEVDSARANVQEFKQMMVEGTPWSRGLQIPLDADCWIGERYRK